MAGRVRRNNDPSMFISDGQIVKKHPGNVDQRGSEPNDLVFGEIDDDALGGWSRYKGGPKKDKASYETTDYIDPNDLPTV